MDVLGLVLSCFVSAANVADLKAASVALVPTLEANPRIDKALADKSYQGSLAERLKFIYNCTLELGQRLGKEFVPEP